MSCGACFGTAAWHGAYSALVRVVFKRAVGVRKYAGVTLFLSFRELKPLAPLTDGSSWNTSKYQPATLDRTHFADICFGDDDWSITFPSLSTKEGSLSHGCFSSHQVYMSPVSGSGRAACVGQSSNSTTRCFASTLRERQYGFNMQNRLGTSTLPRPRPRW